MNVQIDQLVKSLLKKESIQECSLQELEEFAKRHPYFGAAQLMLTKKLQDERSDRYEEQLQKTFTFFNNPLWVQHLLNDTGSVTIKARVTESGSDQSVSKVEIGPNEEKVIMQEVSFTDMEEDPEPPAPVQLKSSSEEYREEETISIQDQPEVVFDISATSEEANPKEEAAREKEEMIFEPYHTVDYFASQGIKMKEEEKPTDRFGQQLRSFTDWLKTMKRLPVGEHLAKSVSPALEEKVEKLAAHSLDEKEVVTEAMAAVWEKQGNRDKAREVYQKLSLLDPSKSVYFAAKIEDLKKKN